MPALSAYANTENTALVILRQKGYQVWYEEKLEMYGAEKNGWDFSANSITELLGVVSIYEHHGSPDLYREYWWKIDDPLLINNVATEKPNFVPVYQKKSNP
jgi:hypothetical protein